MAVDVQRHEGEFDAADGLRLYERSWLPASAPRAVVVIVHGYAEHCGRYAHVGDYLAGHGYAAYAYDQRGHGRSPGERVFTRSFNEYLRDLEAYLGVVRERHAGAPLFLLGHSMGGAVVALALVTSPPDVRGVLLTGPVLPVDAGFAARIVERVMLGIGRIAPRLPLIKLKSANVSRDPAVAAAYDADPLVDRGRVRAGTAAAMVRALRYIRSRRSSIAVPLLIMHGTADALANLDGSRQLYEGAASTDKTLRLFEGLYHEILNEPERGEVLDVIRAWLDARA